MNPPMAYKDTDQIIAKIESAAEVKARMYPKININNKN